MTTPADLRGFFLFKARQARYVRALAICPPCRSGSMRPERNQSMSSSTNANDATTSGGVGLRTIHAGNARRPRTSSLYPRRLALAGSIALVAECLLVSVAGMSRPHAEGAIKHFFRCLLFQGTTQQDTSLRHSINARPAMDALLARSWRLPEVSQSENEGQGGNI